MRLVLKANYKSFTSPFAWDVPRFAFLTGVNGSGKTQLLKCLHLAISRHSGQIIEGATIDQRDCIYLHSGWEIESHDGTIAHNEVAERIRNAAIQIRAHHERNEYGLYIEELRRAISEASGKDIKSLSEEELQKYVPYHAISRINYGSALACAHLTQAICRYNLRKASMILSDRQITDELVEAELGRPPWIAVNSLFEAVGVRHRVVSPEGLHIDQAYRLQVKEPGGPSMAVGDLSSGERFLAGLAILLYNCRQEGRPPKVLILDEPDAHLHPAVISHVIAALRSIGRDFDCRIVASTHRPDTIALCEPQEILEVFPDAPRIRTCSSKADVIGRLSANLLTVLPSTRCVLVEDEDDASFYRVTTSILVQHYRRSLQPLPMFQPVCVGRGQSKVSGGKTVVAHWVEKLANAKLERLVVGLIDKDQGSTTTESIIVLPRYSIENYLFDPLVVFGKLIDDGSAPNISDIRISRGDEHMLRELPSHALQSIADVVFATVAGRIGVTNGGTFIATFLTGQSVTYPLWLRETRGHDLKGHFFAVYPSLGGIEQMIKVFDRLKLLPVDLAEAIQSTCT